MILHISLVRFYCAVIEKTRVPCLCSSAETCVLSAWWSVSIDASVHPGTVGCDLLASNYRAVHLRVEWQPQDSSFCDVQWSGCVCSRGSATPPADCSHPPALLLLVLKKGSSLCDQMCEFPVH